MLLEIIRAVAGVNKVRPVSDAEPLPTSPLGRPVPGAALTITGTSASARAQLRATCSRIRIVNTAATGATYRLGDASVVATAADDYIGPEEALDIAVVPGEYLACLGGVLRVSQLEA
jgi:hypothetical protein